MSEAAATVIEEEQSHDAEEVIQVPAPARSRITTPAAPGLAWSHELDLAQLLAAVGAAQLGEAGDETAAAEEAAAADAAAAAGAPRDLTGVLADQLPPGPALAACLSGTDPAALSEWDLPGVAAAFRRLAAWAQAGELAAVAEMASRTAARDDHVRVDAGRPPGAGHSRRRRRRWAWNWSCRTRRRWRGPASG